MLLLALWEEYKRHGQADMGSSLGSAAESESLKLPEFQFMNNGYNLLYTYFVPGIILRALHMLIYLILTTLTYRRKI